MVWIAGYFAISVVCAALLLWLAFGRNMNCDCGECEPTRSELLFAVAQLGIAGQIAFLAVVVVIAIPLSIYYLVELLTKIPKWR